MTAEATHSPRRNLYIEKRDIKDFLDENMTSLCGDCREKLAEGVSNVTLDMMKNRTRYQYEGRRVSQILVKGQQDTAIEFPSPVTFWVWLDKDSRILRLQFYLGKIFSGTYKRVKRSLTAIIDYEKGSKAIQKVNTVLYRTRMSITRRSLQNLTVEQVHEQAEADIIMLKSSLRQMEELFPEDYRKSNPEFRIAGVSTLTRDYKGKLYPKVEWEEKLFPMCAYEVSSSKKIYHDSSRSSYTKASIGDICTIIGHVLQTCKKFHEKGVVHRDVKSPNILVEYDKTNNGPAGFLTDFDFIDRFGQTEITAKYAFWDLLACRGFVTPTCDVFGAAVALGDMLFQHACSSTSEVRFQPLFPLTISQNQRLTPEFRNVIQRGMERLNELSDGNHMMSYYIYELRCEQERKFTQDSVDQVIAVLQLICETDKKYFDLCSAISREVVYIGQKEEVRKVRKENAQLLDRGIKRRLGEFIKAVKSIDALDDSMENVLEKVEVLKKSKERHFLEDIKDCTELLAFKSDEVDQMCQQLYADIVALQAIASLLEEVYIQDSLLYNYLVYDIEGQKQRHKLADPDTSNESKLKVMDEIYQVVPIFGTFHERLSEIHNQWLSSNSNSAAQAASSSSTTTIY